MRTIHKTNRSRARTSRAVSEALEPRRMLATFNGTSGSDSIFIAKSVNNSLTHVVINGTDNVTGDLSITVNGLGGNDSIDVQSTRSGSTMVVNGGDGNDFLQNTVSDLDAVFPGDFTFVGGNGTDALATDNGTDTAAGAKFLIQADSIFRENPAKFLIRYDEIERLDYADNDNSNTIEFINLQGPEHDIANVTIRGHGGNDTFRNYRLFSAGYWPSSFGTGGVTVDAGPGTDLIALSNVADTSSSYTMTANSIAVGSVFDDGGPLGYFNCESIDLSSSPSSDVVTLNAKPGGMSLRFDSGNGNDSYTVGGGDFDANGFQLANTTLLGGAGADSIEYRDGADFASDTYTWSASSLARTTFGFNASSFEDRTLFASNGLTFSALNTINLNSLASDVTGTTIFGGGAGGISVVNVTQGNLASLFGSLDVNADRLNINDQNSGGPVNGYQVSPTFVSKNNTLQIINYTDVAQLTLNTSGVFDVVSVTGTSAGTALVLNTNGGDDSINVGSGNLDVDFGGAVTVNGGAGLNDVNVFNGSDTTLETMTLNGGTLIDGFSHTFSSVNGFNISLGPGGTNMTVNAAIPKTAVIGGSGNDTFTVGGGNIAANFPAIIASLAPTFNGGGGTDAIILDDFNGAGTGGSYEFQRPAGIDRLARGFGSTWFINWANMESATLEASDAATTGTTTVDIFAFQSLTPLRINGNGGSDRVFVMDPAHPVFVNTGTGTHDQIEANFAGGVPSTVIVEQDDEVNGLRINAGGTLRVAEGATLAKSQLSGVSNYFDITGTLDLAGGALLSRAGGPTPAQFRTQIIAGRNGGAWNGTSASGAINSSTAAASPISDGIGYGLGSQIAPTSIGPFSIAANDTLLRYTRDGDADLNQPVNLADFNRLAGNFGLSGRAWVDGDTNYDGLVNLADFNALAGNFGQAAAAPELLGGKPIRGNNADDDRREVLEQLT